MSGWLAIWLSVPLTFAASWFGGRFHGLIAGSHLRAQTLLSFVGGLMIGMAVLHLVPHAVLTLGSLDTAMYGVLGGVLGVFLLIRFLHVHSHEPGRRLGEPAGVHDHAHEDDDEHDHQHAQSGRVRWMVLLSGLGLHSIVDGVAIASAARLAEAAGGWPGLPVLLVVMLHKPIDAVSLTGTMAASGETSGKRRLLNLLFAMVTPGATLAAYAGFAATDTGAGMAMALAAGAFICVSLADLMPEVQFHSHHRLRLTAALLAGVGLAAGIGVLEGAGHGHDGGSHHGHAH